MQLIIYKQSNGIIAVISPAADALEKYGLKAIAEKDVPEGLPYKIIEHTDLPADRSARNAWTIDDSELTDGVGTSVTSF